MSLTETISLNSPQIAFAGKLCIERCQCHLAHLHALLHLCHESLSDSEDFIMQNVQAILDGMGKELEQSAMALSLFG